MNDVEILCELSVNTYSMCLMIVKTKFWIVTVMPFQLPCVNYCDIVP